MTNIVIIISCICEMGMVNQSTASTVFSPLVSLKQLSDSASNASLRISLLRCWYFCANAYVKGLKNLLPLQVGP